MVLDEEFALSGLQSGRVLGASWPSRLRLVAGYVTVSSRTSLGTEMTGCPAWEEELSSWSMSASSEGVNGVCVKQLPLGIEGLGEQSQEHSPLSLFHSLAQTQPSKQVERGGAAAGTCILGDLAL